LSVVQKGAWLFEFVELGVNLHSCKLSVSKLLLITPRSDMWPQSCNITSFIESEAIISVGSVFLNKIRSATLLLENLQLTSKDPQFVMSWNVE
jgi:hypothetical protein